MKEEIDIRQFDTAEEAIRFLQSEESELIEAKVGIRARTDPEPTPVPDGADVEKHNPDLPVVMWDRTHQALWLLGNHGTRHAGFTNNELVVLSDDDTFVMDRPSPCTNALVQVGYAKRTKRKPAVNCITAKGEKCLEQLGNPDDESAFYEPPDDGGHRFVTESGSAMEEVW